MASLPVLERPVLPENPTREQIAATVNAESDWFARVRTRTRASAIAAYNSGRSFCQWGLEDFLRKHKLPYKTADEWEDTPEPPVEEEYFTDAGLKWAWETRRAAHDEWLAGVRQSALQAHRQGHLTERRLETYLRTTGQPPLQKQNVYNGSVSIQWTEENQRDKNGFPQALKARIMSFAEELGFSPEVEVSLRQGKELA